MAPCRRPEEETLSLLSWGKSVTEKVLLCSSSCNKHHDGGLTNRPFSLPVLGARSLRSRGQHGWALSEALFLVC